MRFPTAVQAYLDGWMQNDAKPFCCRISRSYTLKEMHGDGSSHGLEGLAIGDDLRAVAPFLEDYRWDASVVLPLVSSVAGFASHLHLIPYGEDRLVIYLDARDEFASKQRSQQAANETRLLNHRQRRLLEDLVDAKAELDRRRREAEDNSRRKSEFIASMSHEFRTPLTAVIGYARLLREQSDLDTAIRKKVNAIERASDHLLSLVESLLEQARLEIGGIEIRRVVTDLRRMLEDLSIVLTPLASEKGLSFEVSVDSGVPGFIEVDELRLRQILLNLLGNAIKFTEYGSVTLSVTWESGDLNALVVDTGPGIPQGDQKRIFDAFHRAAAQTRRPGAGLGLTIALRLAELMGGNIQIDSSVGRGTAASVRLPARAMSGPVVDDSGIRRQDVETGGRTQTAHILVAEDDEEIVRLVSLHLEGAGYRVSVASNGRQAVDTALAESPDLLVMDVNMPLLDGPAAARELRDQGYAGPILALTGSELAENAEFALACGFTDYLRKPFHVPELLSALVRLLLNART